MAKKRNRNRPKPKAAAPDRPEPASETRTAVDPEDLDDAAVAQPKSKLGKVRAGGGRWKPSGEKRRNANADRLPAFWSAFEISWAKLATARIVVFTLLAIGRASCRERV